MENETEVITEVQQGWDILDSVTKYLIWMCPLGVFSGDTRDMILRIREDYILMYPYRSFSIHRSQSQNEKWHRMYDEMVLLSRTGGIL